MGIVTGVFSAIKLVLELLGLWHQFQDFSDKERLKKAQENTDARDKAVDQQTGAKSEDDFDRAQDGIVDHKPR